MVAISVHSCSDLMTRTGAGEPSAAANAAEQSQDLHTAGMLRLADYF
jgi:hypothetical protein